MTFDYAAYEKNIEKYTNQMDFKQSVKTKRKGTEKVRDSFINFERFHSEGNSYLSLVLSLVSMMITWTALSDVAMAKFNMWWALLAILIVGTTTYFGYLSYTKLGLIGRTNELSGKTDSGRFQLWAEIQDVKTQNIFILQQLDEILDYNATMKKMLRRNKRR